MKTAIWPVEDLAQAKGLADQLLGMEPSMDAPHYVGHRMRAGRQARSERALQGSAGPRLLLARRRHPGHVAALRVGGEQTVQDIEDLGGAKLITQVSDADGNVFGLIQMP
ncbi:glyoxalase [Streptomyces iconiensis]|uniref:glyoxalase n=1 Tax=Streptomyces iconiensis TaxID=1384038 RepID=UPI0032192E42